METQQYGLCIVTDKYFRDFSNIRHMDNKYENRPYYLAIRAKNEIVWLVPLSSQADKYRAKIKVDEQKYGDSVFHYIAKVRGEDKAFLIGNMIPVTEEYIKKPFTICGVPFVIGDKTDIKRIQSKASRYLSLVRCGKLTPVVDILEIERKLLNRIENTEFII